MIGVAVFSLISGEYHDASAFSGAGGMTEYRTKSLNRQLLLDELSWVSSKLRQAGIHEAQVSFGWDCNLPIDEMWQDRNVRVDEILEFVCQAERKGIVEIGHSDIFVESQDFRLTLCHEGGAHVAGTVDLVREMVERWEQLNYQPYEITQQP